MANLTKEQKFLRDNPNGTPYDMLMAGAITQERFDELNKGTGEATQTVNEFLADKKPKKAVPVQVITHSIKPELSEYNPPTTGNVYLNDKKTGKTTWMSAGAAERERKKYPHRYTITY